MSILSFRRQPQRPAPIALRDSHRNALLAIAAEQLREDATYECVHATTGQRLTYQANDLVALELARRGNWADDNTRLLAITDAGEAWLRKNVYGGTA